MFPAIMRKAFWFAALGMMTVLLIGPVVAVVGIILPFALIGALVWLVWRGMKRCAKHFCKAAVVEEHGRARVLPVAGHDALQALPQGVRDAGGALRERGRWLGEKMATFAQATMW